ncbi:methyltransferase domain-containing protein [Streptomyces sp. NPDC050617]|uniref:class I SAM-dependent methyltransferase n=1 Tax=Streptomyces sp. NPDC050617 TaxID=3154628 RepID=UPI00342E9391
MTPRARSFDEFAEEYERLHNLTGDPVGAWLAERLPVRGGRALDLGCGTGRHAVLLAERFAEVDAVDVSPAMVRIAAATRPRENIRYRVGGHTELSADGGDGGYDLVLSVSTLHHLDGLPEALARVKRLVAPGGLAVLHDGVCEGRPPSRRRLYAREVRRLCAAAARGPRSAARSWEVFRLRTGAWLEHRVGDRFLSRAEFEHIHGAVFDAARFEEAPNGYAMLWRRPLATAGPAGSAERTAVNR